MGIKFFYIFSVISNIFTPDKWLFYPNTEKVRKLPQQTIAHSNLDYSPKSFFPFKMCFYLFMLFELLEITQIHKIFSGFQQVY